MKIQKHKCAISFGLILFLALSVFVAVAPLGTADNLYSHSTTIFCVAAPNPIGVGQTVYISYLVANVPPPAIPANNPRFGEPWHGITLTITSPDGSVKNMTDLSTSYAGAGTTTFVPTVTGNYTFVATFPGQTITSGPSVGQVYLPSTSNKATLEVTSTPAASTSFPLPSEYWTYPIEGENQAWSIYTGNWLAGLEANASAPSVWNPYSPGPYSAHVVWSQPWVTGGLVGGSYQSQIYGNGRYPGGGNTYFTPFVANGIMYVNIPPMYTPQSFSSGGYVSQAAGFEAIDLATGKVLWTQPNCTDSLSYLEVLSYQDSTMGVGVIQLLWSCNSSGGTWRTYDPQSGNLVQAITGVPSGGKVTFGPNGELLVYYINANGWMAMWNSTYFEGAAAQLDTWSNGPQNAPNTVYITPQGTYSFNLGYQWNITIPKMAGVGTVSNQLSSILPNDLMILGSRIAPTNTTGFYLQVMGISIKPGQYKPAATNALGLGANQTYTGNQAAQVLFNPENISMFMNTPTGTYGSVNSLGYTKSGVPVFVIFQDDKLQTSVYNANTGALMYNTEPMTNPLSTYDGDSNNVQCADGKLFQCGYDGMMYCYDLESGGLLWSYYAGNAGLNTPYGTYPIEGSYSYYSIADGLIIASYNEHSPTDPTWLGAQVFALNETTGKIVWSIDGEQWDSCPIVVAEGQAIFLNWYDGKLYDLGKGPSATTVSAPQASLTKGQSVTITGTVMDKSAGTTQTEQTGRFPNGLPAMSDASMNEWMNYIYMQKPKPTNATGVLVTLSVVDSNGNYRTIGTTTTDTYGFFSYQWVPDIEGKYTVYASFAGSDSYWPSSAVTAFSVDPASLASSPQPTQAPSMADLYFVPGIIGVIVVVIVVGAVILFALRKRP
jgi:PQQ enzyme repeat.